MVSDNPAARLLKILSDGKKIPATNKCKEGWAKLLMVKDLESPDLMMKLGMVMTLPSTIIKDIQEHYPSQHNSHTHWSNKVNTAFSKQNLNGQWNEFIGHIDTHKIQYLSMTADLLDMKESTKIMSAEELTGLRESIQSALEEAINTNLDPDFKNYIVHYLNKIIIAIDEYRILGIKPILESIESTLGHSFLDVKYREELMTGEFGKKLTATLSAAASIVTIAVGLPQLPELLPALFAPS